jgi:AraC-like DNA-binding protein
VRATNQPDAVKFPSATGTITRLAYAHAKREGVAIDPLLKKAHLTKRQIENPDERLNVRHQIRFLNLAATALGDDLLGFHLAQHQDLREIGLLYYVLASSETLIEALQRASRYSSIVNEGISLRCIDDEDVGLSLEYVGISRHLDRHQIELWVTAIVRICRRLTGLNLIPTRLRFIHRRANGQTEMVEFFGEAVEFGARRDEVAFARRVRSLPVVSADPYLNRLLVSYCEEALSRRPGSRGSFRSRVENAIVPLLPHGKPGAGDIARHLGLSRRTFARRLEDEGVTFSELLKDLRASLASRYLADDSLTVSQIAWLLGYKETTAFSHAFRRWTGQTPGEARGPAAATGKRR